jgi:hypothetical protein
VGQPQLVIANEANAWGTALWFWNTNPTTKGAPHDAIVGGNFGQTTNIINGGLECGASPTNTTGAAARAAIYQEFNFAIGSMPYTTTTC